MACSTISKNGTPNKVVAMNGNISELYLSLLKIPFMTNNKETWDLYNGIMSPEFLDNNLELDDNREPLLYYAVSNDKNGISYKLFPTFVEANQNRRKGESIAMGFVKEGEKHNFTNGNEFVLSNNLFKITEWSGKVTKSKSLPQRVMNYIAEGTLTGEKVAFNISLDELKPKEFNFTLDYFKRLMNKLGNENLISTDVEEMNRVARENGYEDFRAFSLVGTNSIMSYINNNPEFSSNLVAFAFKYEEIKGNKEEERRLFFETGFYEDVKGNTRYETSPFELINSNPEIGPVKKLSEIIDIKELSKFYPKLGNANIVFLDDSSSDYYASYNSTPNLFTINLNKDKVEEYKRTRKIDDYISTNIAHEVQHYIQSIEDLPNGSNPKEINRIYSNVLRPKLEQLQKKYNATGSDKAKMSIKREFDSYQTKLNIKKSLPMILSNPQAYEIYFRLIGESEARSAELRQAFKGIRINKTPIETQLQNFQNYININDLIDKFGERKNDIKFLKKPNQQIYGMFVPNYKGQGPKIFINPEIANNATTIEEIGHMQYYLLDIAAKNGDVEAQKILAKGEELFGEIADKWMGVKGEGGVSENNYQALIANKGISELIKINPQVFSNLTIFSDNIDKVRGNNELERKLFFETGFYLDTNNKLRYETSPFDINLTNITYEETYNISEIVDMKELSSIYNEVNDLKIKFSKKINDDKIFAIYNESQKLITINSSNEAKKQYGNIGRAVQYYEKANIAHEIQHFLQEREGLPVGNSVPGIKKAYETTNRKKLLDIQAEWRKEKSKEKKLKLQDRFNSYRTSLDINKVLPMQLTNSQASVIYTESTGEAEARSAEIRESNIDKRTLLSPNETLLSNFIKIRKEDLINDFKNPKNIFNYLNESFDLDTPIQKLKEETGIDLTADVYRQGNNESNEAYRKRLIDEIRNKVVSEYGAKQLESNQPLIQKIKDFFKDLYEWFQKQAGLQGRDVSSMTLQEFVDASYNSIMKGEWMENEQYNSQINKIKEYARKVINGESTLKRLDESEETGRINSGARGIEASILAGISQRTAEEIERGVSASDKQKEELEKYAKEEGIWFEDYDTAFGPYLDEGGESLVYIGDNSVYKVNDLSFNDSNPLSFLDRVALHNDMFTESMYEVIGFTKRKDNGRFSVIVKQTFYDNKRVLTDRELSKYMKSIGFTRIAEFSYKNDRYILDDLHGKNVYYEISGRVVFIDPIIRLNTPDQNYKGVQEYRDIMSEEDMNAIENAEVSSNQSNDIRYQMQQEIPALRDVESTAKALDEKINVRKSSIAVRLRKLSGIIAHGGENTISKFDFSKIKGGLRGRYGKGIYFSSLFKNYDYGNKSTYLDISKLILMNGNMTIYEALSTLEMPSKIKTDIEYLKNYLSKVKNNRDYDEILSEIRKLESKYSKFDENSKYIERTFQKEADKNPSERLDSILENLEARVHESNNLDSFKAIKGLEDSLNNMLIESGFDGINFDEGREILIIPQEKINDYIIQSQEKFISEAYHKAKKDGSNPELVEAVEDLLSNQTSKLQELQQELQQKNSEPIFVNMEPLTEKEKFIEYAMQHPTALADIYIKNGWVDQVCKI